MSELITQITLFLSAFLCLFLAFFLLSNKKSRSVPNLLFSGLLISYAFARFDWLLRYHKMIMYIYTLHINFVGDAFFVLIAPFLLLYVQSLTVKHFKIRLTHLLHALPFFLLLTQALFRYTLFDAETKRALLVNSDIRPIFPKTESFTLGAIAGVQMYSYYIISLVILSRYKRKLKDNYSSHEGIKLSWLSNILVLFLSIEIFAFIKHNIMMITGIYDDIFVNVLLISYVYLILYILYKGMQHQSIFNGIEIKNGKQSWSIPDFLLENYNHKLKNYMEQAKPFLIPTLSLDDLAEKINITPRYLSIVINKIYNQNFFNYVNSYRIKEAEKLLSDKNNSKNVLEILFEVGFNSKSVFNDCFRRETGLTPSQYRNMHFKPELLKSLGKPLLSKYKYSGT